jgi:hypothetical protein
MKNVSAETAKEAGQKPGQKTTPREISGENTAQSTALDRRYGQIGISAVAAAARYQGVAKNPAYAPAPTK